MLSGIEIMKKEFKGLFKIRLRLDPTQAVSTIKTLQQCKVFFYVQKKFEIYHEYE